MLAGGTRTMAGVWIDHARRGLMVGLRVGVVAV
jgi:hypothetical protein